MTLELKRIEYRSGVLEPGMEPSELPVRVWEPPQLAAKTIQVVEHGHLQNLAGIHGTHSLWIPVQYDELKLLFPDKLVEITVYNRHCAIAKGKDEKIREIDHLLRALQDREP